MCGGAFHRHGEPMGAFGAAAILIAAVPTFVIDSDSWAESVFICGAACIATVMAAATQRSQPALRPRA